MADKLKCEFDSKRITARVAMKLFRAVPVNDLETVCEVLAETIMSVTGVELGGSIHDKETWLDAEYKTVLAATTQLGNEINGKN